VRREFPCAIFREPRAGDLDAAVLAFQQAIGDTEEAAVGSNMYWMIASCSAPVGGVYPVGDFDCRLSSKCSRPSIAADDPSEWLFTTALTHACAL
jgi:hypothetical protein